MRLVNNLFKIRFWSFQTAAVKLNVDRSMDAKKLISFFEFAEICFSKKMDMGAQWLTMKQVLYSIFLLKAALKKAHRPPTTSLKKPWVHL